MKINIRKAHSCDFETLVLTPEQIKNGERTYVWAWADYQIYDNDDDYVVTGNSIASFFEHIQHLWKPVLYFHNLKFDGSFILNYLFDNGYSYSKEDEPITFDSLISKQGQWYMIEIRFPKIKGKMNKCYIYDSLKKLPFSVAEIAKAFNLGDDMQKLDLDYEKWRPEDYIMTEEEKDYIKHDVMIVGKALRMQFEEGMIKMTNGADSISHYMELLGGKKKFQNIFPIIDLELDALLRKSYFGGYVYCNEKYAKLCETGEVGKSFVVDKNSMHPSMMCKRPMPYGMPEYFEEEYKGDSKFYIQKLECRFKLKDRYIPTIQIKKNMMYCDTEYLKESKVSDEIDEPVILRLPSPDLEIFFKHYDVWDIEWLGGWAFKTATGEFFNEYIELLMKIKAHEEGVKRLMAKLKMNSLYGKTGTNPEVTGKIPYKEDGKLKFKKPTEIIVEDGEEKEVEVKEYRDPVYLPLAIAITAWSRHDMISTIDMCNARYIKGESDIDRFVYTDTDSGHFLGWHIPRKLRIHESDLDAWKVENYNIGAKYLRQKTYIDKVIVRTKKEKKKYDSIVADYRINIAMAKHRGEDPNKIAPHFGYQNGKFYYIEVKCAGMPNNIKNEVSYDAFRTGFKSEKKLIGHQVKGGVVLCNDKFEIKPKSF